jgi:hypothetical protein
MKKNISEEIERFKLLSNYDNKRTLTENVDDSDILNEQWKDLLKNIFRTGAKETRLVSKGVAKEIESLFKSFPNEFKKFGVDAAEIASKLSSGTFTKAELGELRVAVFKNTSNDTIRKEIADEMVKSKSFKDVFTSNKQNRVLDELIKKGYSGDDAKFLVDRYVKGGGKFYDDIIQSSTKTRNTKPPTKQRFSNYQYPASRGVRNNAMSLIRTVTMAPSAIWKLFKTLFKLGLGLAVAYYIWKYFTGKGEIGYPDCLSKNIPAEDFKKMVEEGREHVLITDTGNEFIDSNGGGRFYQNGKFETENEKYYGSWKEDKTVGIVILLSNGDEEVMSCEGIVDFELDTEETEITYKPKSDFPFGLGDENKEIIGSVQRCLGLAVDGKFSFELQKALEDNNYGSTLTKSTFKLIMKDCGAGEQTSGYLSSLI